MQQHPRKQHRRSQPGFTLVELLVVIAIIGLIISLILVAAADGVRRAEERATQGLITKLETGINDRLDALQNAQAPINQTHRYLAAITFPSPTVSGAYIPVGNPKTTASDERRAQVIAQYDYIRAELPDVFFRHSDTSDGVAFTTGTPLYPLNFGGAPYPIGATGYGAYYLPLGNLSLGLPTVQDPADATKFSLAASYQPPLTGIFGASFSAAGGLYKNLYAAAASDVVAATPGVVITPGPAYDGVDNNGDGAIDSMEEVSVVNAGKAVAVTATSDFAKAVYARLDKHTHKTARAEMLYAILVEGLGPLGSVFNRDEFTNREVQDTDGDGMPEFIDAWGEPIQFYRWPIYFGTVAGSSDSQKGSNLYNGFPEYRQLDPLDPNQLLVSPGWWALVGNLSLPTDSKGNTVTKFKTPNGNAVPAEASQAAAGFMNYFGILLDPSPLDATSGTSWDRTGGYSRRAYFSKFLVLSSGPDKQPGVAQFDKKYSDLTDDNTGNSYTFPISGSSIAANVAQLLMIENQASQTDPSGRTGSFFEIPNGHPNGSSTTSVTVYLQNNAGLDDISNHNTSAPSTGVR